MIAWFLHLITFYRASYRQQKEKSKHSPSKYKYVQISRVIIVPPVINYDPARYSLATSFSCLVLRNRDDLFTCAEKCKLHSGDDNFQRTDSKHGLEPAKGKGGGTTPRQATSRQSVYSVLDSTSASGPTVVRQMPPNQHAIVRASRRRKYIETWSMQGLVYSPFSPGRNSGLASRTRLSSRHTTKLQQCTTETSLRFSSIKNLIIIAKRIKLLEVWNLS